MKLQLSSFAARAMNLFLLGLVRVLTGAQARWHGCPPKVEQRIYFANHQSHADLVLIWAALPQELRNITRPIAAKDYWTRTALKKWITTAVFNAIYVDPVAPARCPAPKGARPSPSSLPPTRWRR
jgi:1-acyl-sn-glycerol-3-phosphate acyltransferase